MDFRTNGGKEIKRSSREGGGIGLRQLDLGNQPF